MLLPQGYRRCLPRGSLSIGFVAGVRYVPAYAHAALLSAVIKRGLARQLKRLRRETLRPFEALASARHALYPEAHVGDARSMKDAA